MAFVYNPLIYSGFQDTSAGGGGGGTPGGATGNVQYNNAGAFAGSANLFWDNTNGRLGIGTNSPATTLDVNGSFGLDGSTSGRLTQSASASTTSYSVTWPAAQASGTQVLQNNGSGVLSWATASGATPGGSQGQFQYNNSGTFAGTTNLIWDGSKTISLLTAVSDTIIKVGDNSGSNNYIAMTSRHTQVDQPNPGAPSLVWSVGNGNPGWISSDDNTNSSLFSGNTFDLYFATGHAVGNSGNLNFTPGTASGTVGKIKLNDRSGTITADQVWTATASDGSGHWASPTGGSGTISASQTSLNVTDARVTTTSLVIVMLTTNDVTAYIKNIVPNSGNFDINLGAATTGNTNFKYYIVQNLS